MKREKRRGEEKEEKYEKWEKTQTMHCTTTRCCFEKQMYGTEEAVKILQVSVNEHP